MKVYRSFYAMALLMVVLLITVIFGCKYDVAEPQWDSPAASSTEVTITGIVPAQATPGVNIITIVGTNLSGALDSNRVTKHFYYTDSLNVKRDTIVYDSTTVYNGVYFDQVQATVVACSPTMIKVLRPNVASDTCKIKIASSKALAVVKYGPYKVNSVLAPFGSFNENYALNAIAVDHAENVYVVKGTSPYTVYKITPSGDKISLGAAARQPLDAKIGPDGNLYYMGNGTVGAKPIGMINTTTQTDSLWLNSTKYLSCFDFAPNGYMYTAGSRIGGLLVIRPNKSVRLQTNLFTLDTVFAIRVFNGYVYAAIGTDASTPARAIYRCSLADTGNIGAKELVLDLTQTGNAYSPIRSISFSSDGSKMFVGFMDTNPLLMVDVASKSSEILYKGIVPDYCKHFCFGSNGIYAIIGNTATTAPVTPAVEWKVYKIDVGKTGAPYY